MKTLRTGLSFIRAVVLASILSQAPLSAQEEETCYRCADDILNDEHRIEEIDPEEPVDGWTSEEGEHGWDPDNCLESEHGHQICEETEEEEEDTQAGLDLIMLMEADRIHSLSAEELSGLVARAGVRVNINRERQAIQVLDCHMHVIAHAPLDSEAFGALMSELADLNLQ